MTSAASPSGRELPLALLSEVAIAGVTAAAVFGLRRLFAGADWFVPLLIQVVLAHLVAAGLRRAGVPLVAAFPIVLLVGFYVAALIYANENLVGGILPTGEVFADLRGDLDVAWSSFADVRAPTEAIDGFLIASSLSIWLTAALADWAAFRIDAAFEAVLPSSTLFVLVAILGASAGRAVSTAVWLGAVLAFLLFRRADRLGQRSTWVGELRHRGPLTLIGAGAAISLIALTLASVFGPRLPGADSAAIVSLQDIGNDQGPGSRVTVSPLVDIRSRLVNQRDVEVFRVRSNERAYWRLTSLDRFNGQIWSSNGSFGRESGDLPEGIVVPPDNVTFDQEIEISALSQIWLPAAYEPAAISTSTDVRYDETSGTLIVDTDIPTSNGMRYVVRSALPVFDPGSLAGASREIPAEIAERYLDLPADFSPAVADVARQVAGSGSVYDQMLQLQMFFRDNFTYNLAVGPGHDDDALEQFVNVTREGYCEQFAGAFAAMARSLGIPARVAVGFTPGDQSPTDPTLFSVRGEHAHAWPEVYIGEFGWVAFEPTPGRGAPRAENYTGVPEQQAAAGDPNVATTLPPVNTSVAPQAGDPAAPSTTRPGEFDLPDLGDIDQASGSPASSGRGIRWLQNVAKVAIAGVALIALYLLIVPIALLAHHRRRRQRATTASAQIGLAWDESIEAIEDAGVRVSPGVTHREVARQLTTALPTVAGPMTALAATVEAATFAPDDPDPTAGETALALADEVRHAADGSLAGRERLRERYLPSKVRARQRRRRDRPRAGSR